MRHSLWISPMFLMLAACSKPTPNGTAAAASTQPAEASAPVAGAKPATETAAVLLSNGTRLRVRINDALNTRQNKAGDGFTATLHAAVKIEDRVVIPAGTQFKGHVTTADSSGRLQGRAQLTMTLDSFELNGREHRIDTNDISRFSQSHKKRNAVMIGGGSGLGAAIGGIAGGGKGALIGAAAGAGAGTAGAAATGKLETGVAAETLLVFNLTQPVRI